MTRANVLQEVRQMRFENCMRGSEDRPISLSSPLERRALTLRAPYRIRRCMPTIPPAPALLDEFLMGPKGLRNP